MKLKNLIIAGAIATCGAVFAAENAPAPQPDSLDELLKIVRQAETTVSKENQQRLRTFQSQRNQQQRLLNEARAELARQEARSDQLRQTFDGNEKTLAELTEKLRIKLGNLGEAVGVVRQVAAEASATIGDSIVSAQYPGRKAILDELAGRQEIPVISELRQLWYELQREMTEQGKVARFTGKLLDRNGVEVERTIDRVGTFNLVSDGEYIILNKDTSKVQQLSNQPKGGEFTSTLQDFQSASSYAMFPFDRSQGQIVVQETKREGWLDRVREYGGFVGFAIIGVLFVGIIIAAERSFSLTMTGGKMRKQQKDPNPGNNPLGRVMAVYHANKDDSIENLELKLDEAVLKELPKIEARIGVIKILAAVSPLMGLLGTVTGMIETFQGITLYGSGDPSVMAEGISQALITTVLGIVSAIPLILLHALVAGKSKTLVHVLEEQSAGLVAQHSEGK